MQNKKAKKLKRKPMLTPSATTTIRSLKKWMWSTASTSPCRLTCKRCWHSKKTRLNKENRSSLWRWKVCKSCNNRYWQIQSAMKTRLCSQWTSSKHKVRKWKLFTNNKVNRLECNSSWSNKRCYRHCKQPKHHWMSLRLVSLDKIAHNHNKFIPLLTQFKWLLIINSHS